MKTIALFVVSLLIVLACSGRAEAATSMRPASLAASHVSTTILPVDAGFAVAPVSDDALANTYGAGIGRAGRDAALAAVHDGIPEHVGVNTRVALDVWFTEVADPLILSNLERAAPPR